MTKTADEFFALTPAKRDLFSGGTTKSAEPVRLPEGSLLPDDPQIRQTLTDAAEKYKINPALLFAMAHQESTYNPNAVGPTTKWGTAKGMFQFLDSTAKGHGIDAFNYTQAADSAAKDLAAQILKDGPEWAVAHHHGGPNKKLHGPKTRRYAQEVLAKAEAIAKELGVEFTGDPRKVAAAATEPTATKSADEFFGDTTAPAAPAAAPKKAPVEEESLGDTFRKRVAQDMAETGIPVPGLAQGVAGVKRSIARGWEGVQNILNRETEEITYTDEELRRKYETEVPAMNKFGRNAISFQDYARQNRTRTVSKNTVREEEAAWRKRLAEKPEDAYLLPKRLSHLRQPADDSKFAPANTFKGFAQRIVAGHKTPMDLLLQDSIPANIVTHLANLPEAERQKFDRARAVTKAMEIQKDADASEEAQAWSNETLKQWNDETDSSVKKAWNALYDAASENPAQVGLAFSEALFADPYMVMAPVGIGLKPVRAVQAVQGIRASTVAGRAAKVADAIIDGSVTAGTLNVAAGAAENLATTGTVNEAEVKLNAAMGVILGGGLAPLFMKGARAKSRLHDTDKLRADGALDEAMQDAAKADVEMESQISGLYDADYGIGAKETPIQKRLRELFGIQSKEDAKKVIDQRRKDIKETFKNESDYADYLNFVAQEKLDRAAALAAEAEAKAAAQQAAADAVTTRAAVYREQWQSEFDAAIEAREALKDSQSDIAWQKHEEAAAIADRLNADELAESLYTGDSATIKQTEAKIARREAGLNRPKWQRGETNPQVLAALGITAAGATAGAAMFPNDQKKGMVAGAILSGLSAVGLGRAVGSKGRLGAPSVISQQGAIKPKGGNWHSGAVNKLEPSAEPHFSNITQKYLNRYAGTAEDPLKDIILPDGTRWEDAMDLAIRRGMDDSYGQPTWKLEMPAPHHDQGRAMQKIRSYMDHVSDYLRTLPESEVAKMDFVRMVKETKRWDEANARKMEKAQVKFFKDAEVLKEYDDGFKWIRLNKPGQFANESDLMGHSVRGYEPYEAHESYSSLRERLRADPYIAALGDYTGPTETPTQIPNHPDWIPESVGGQADYGYGGWDAIKNDEARVYSLRDSKGKPVATVEIGKTSYGDWKISQIKGPRNEPVKKNYSDKIQDIVSYAEQELDALRSYDISDWPTEAGKADPETLARLGVVAGGAAAGFALADEDSKLSGTLLGGLAGLVVPAGGSVLSRMRQSGAIASDGQIISALVKSGKLANKLEEADIIARDNAWIDLARTGDQQGFRYLYDSYIKEVERFVYKFVSNRESRLALTEEDLASEAMTKAFMKLQEDPDFVLEKPFVAFVKEIASNRAKDVLDAHGATKRGSGAAHVSEDVAGTRDSYSGDPATSAYSLMDNYAGRMAEGDAVPSDIGTSELSNTPEAALVRDQTLDIIRQSLDGMPQQAQDVFTKVHLQHYTLEEAAKELGISTSGAWHQLRRVENVVRDNIAKDKLKFGEPAKPAEGVRGPRNQRGEASTEHMGKVAAVTAAATAAGTAGYFLYDGDPWKTFVSAGFGAAGAAGLAGGGGKVLSKALRGVDYRIREFGPSLYGLAKKHGFSELKGIREYNNATADFINMFHALKDDLKPTLIEALSTRDRAVIDKMLNHLGGKDFVEAFDKVRVKLDEVEDLLVGYGLISKSEKDYFPFRVKDLEGLKKELGKDFATDIEAALAKAEATMKEKAGRELNDIERGIITNKVLEPYLGKPLGPQRPGFSKARTIQRIPERLQKYYHDPVETLNSYGVQAIKYIERAKFFGKHLVKKKENGKEFVDVSRSIGELVDDLRKKDQLTDQQVFELKNILQDRFNGGEKGTNRFLAGMKNLVNASLLGHMASAVVQLGDIALQGLVHGPRASVKALRRQFTRNKLRKLDDFGLNEHVAHEFLSDGWTRKVSDWSFKWGGFRAIDATGKNFGLNAAIERMMKDARTPEGQMRLADQYQRYFPDDYPKALAALKKGEINEAVELLAFTDLTKTQPLTQWELPQFYQKFPNGRVLYHLQTFSIRVMNLVYEEALKDIVSGNLKQATRGTKRLFAIGAVLGVQGVATDKIKDVLAGKEVELSFEEIPINALEAMGLSLYDYNRIADKGPLAGFAESKMPPVLRMSNDLLNEPERSLRYVPVGGRAAYDFFREPLEERRKERRKAQGYKMEINVPAREADSSRSDRTRTRRPERKRRERS